MFWTSLVVLFYYETFPSLSLLGLYHCYSSYITCPIISKPPCTATINWGCIPIVKDFEMLMPLRTITVASKNAIITHTHCNLFSQLQQFLQQYGRWVSQQQHCCSEWRQLTCKVAFSVFYNINQSAEWLSNKQPIRVWLSSIYKHLLEFPVCKKITPTVTCPSQSLQGMPTTFPLCNFILNLSESLPRTKTKQNKQNSALWVTLCNLAISCVLCLR